MKSVLAAATIAALFPAAAVAGTATGIMEVSAYVPPVATVTERNGVLSISMTDPMEIAFLRVGDDMKPVEAVRDASAGVFIRESANTYESPVVVLHDGETLDVRTMLPRGVTSGEIIVTEDF